MTLLVPKFLQGVDPPLPQYSAQTMRLMLAEQWDEGVLGGLRVSERGAGANFTVDISAGSVIVKGDDFTDQGNYEGESTALESRNISPAPGSGTRFDIVIARINDEQAGGPSTNDMTIEVITGTIDAGAPVVPPTALLLATIGPIISSTPSIDDSLITDDRVWAGRKATPGTVEAVHHLQDVAGWLDADGSTVNTADFPRLADILGETGPTMALPDLRGRSLVGANGPAGTSRVTGQAVGDTGGESAHTQTVSEMANHDHTIQVAGSHSHATASGGQFVDTRTQASYSPGGGGLFAGYSTSAATTGSVGNHSHNAVAAGLSTPFNVVHPYGTVRWLIRT